jgi:hypothetical protein
MTGQLRPTRFKNQRSRRPAEFSLPTEGGNGEEVDRNHAAEVIAKERFPVLGRGATRTRDHVFGDGSLREGDPELEQLAVNPGSAPQWIGVVDVPDQGDEVWGNGFPAGFASTAFPSPEESKPCAMPLKDRAGLNQEQPGLPSSPGPGKPSPKNTVQRRQARSSGAPALHEQLVSQGQDFQEQVPTRFQPGNGQVKHER